MSDTKPYDTLDRIAERMVKIVIAVQVDAALEYHRLLEDGTTDDVPNLPVLIRRKAAAALKDAGLREMVEAGNAMALSIALDDSAGYDGKHGEPDVAAAKAWHQALAHAPGAR